MNVYFLSGLGADKRVFSRLQLSEELVIKHIDWITAQENESLSNYATRLCDQISPAKPFVLVGLSFGGIMAVEISKLLQPEKVILISSVSERKQLPWYYRVSGKLHLPKVVPSFVLKRSNSLTSWFFGAKDKDLQVLLKHILADTDTHFLKWAINMIPNWNNKKRPENLIHIHGNNDKVLPLGRMNVDFQIDNGGHLMVYEQHQEISAILNQCIN